MMKQFSYLLACASVLSTQLAVGQNPAPPSTPASVNQLPPSNTVRPDYVLGPNDQILIRVPQATEINERPFRVDTEGFITLPIVGRVRAAGSTVQALETDVAARLREFIRDPQVIITVTQFRSEPVFVTGAFLKPGIYPLEGHRTLVELLSNVGGLLPNASRRVRVTRRADYGPIPLPNAVEDKDKRISTVDVSLQSLSENINPAEDIILQANDIVTADRAEKVYVNGEVTKVAGIELGERETISVTQALTEAGGFTQFADHGKVRILRPVLGTSRRAEIVLAVDRIFAGKDIDFPLLPNDVLYVPRSALRTLSVPLNGALITAIPYALVTAGLFH